MLLFIIVIVLNYTSVYLCNEYKDVGNCVDRECSLQNVDYIESNTKLLWKTNHSSVNNYFDCKGKGSYFWHGYSMFCVHKSNSPLLGYYYDEISVATSLNQFFALHSQISDKLKVTNKYSSNIDKLEFTSFKYGSPLISLVHFEIRPFQVPFSILPNVCAQTVPLRYMVNYETSCPVRLNSHSCLSSTKWVKHFLPFFENQKLTLITKDGLQSIETVITINDSIWNSNNKTDWPNSYVSQMLCKNVVKNIELVFFWNQTGIVYVSVSIALTDVSLNVGFIDQYFNIKFEYSEASYSEPVPKLSHMGYRNLDVIPAVFNKQTDGISFTETSLSNTSVIDNDGIFHFEYLKFPTLNHGSKCNSTSLKYVTFGINYMTSCWINPPKDIMADCHLLRNFIQAKLLESVPAYLHSGNNMSNLNENFSGTLVPVFIDLQTFMNNESYSHTTCFTTQKIQLIVLFVQEKVMNTDISRIVGAKAISGPVYPIFSNKIELQFSIHFSNVNDPDKHISRFWRKSNKDDCSGDICWEEILLPFVFYKPHLQLDFVLASTGIFLLFIISFNYLKLSV